MIILSWCLVIISWTFTIYMYVCRYNEKARYELDMYNAHVAGYNTAVQDIEQNYYYQDF
jgi:hypothetical protein